MADNHDWKTTPWNDDAQIPRFAELELSTFNETLTQGLDQGVRTLEDMYQRPELDAEALLFQADAVETKMFEPWSLLSHLNSVVTNPDIRAMQEQHQPRVIEVSQRLSQNLSLFEKLKSYLDTAPEEQPMAVRRSIALSYEGMLHSGAALLGATKDRFNQLQQDLAQLSQDFANHIVDATAAFRMVLSESDIDGCPDSLKQQMWSADEQAYVVTLDYPVAIPFLKNAKRRDLRERVYRAYITRASDGELDNAPLMKSILEKRHEVATILGFNTYADLSIHSKMAEGPDDARALLLDVFAKARVKAEEEWLALVAFAEAELVDDIDLEGGVEPWDVAYVSERLKEKSYAYKEEETQAYFPLEQTLEGLLGVASDLFGITASLDSDVIGWHDDVRFYWVQDRTGKNMAGFFLDPYVRSGQKRPGAWMNDCRDRDSKTGTLPIAYLVLNASRPTDSTPALLTFSMVETLFHEFGHGLQHMLTTIEVPGVGGIGGVEWDAVELPSQFMENWCYHWPMIQRLARHYETGAVMEKSLFDRIEAAKNFQTGMALCRQIYFGLMDLELHGGKTFASADDILVYQRQKASEILVTPTSDEDAFLCAFGHIFAGGYAAGYYSYLWAEVLSADAFSAFEEAGLDNLSGLQECGQRFKDTVLSLGGSQTAREVYHAFRGQPPTPDALLRHRGVV